MSVSNTYVSPGPGLVDKPDDSGLRPLGPSFHHQFFILPPLPLPLPLHPPFIHAHINPGVPA